MKTFQRVFGLLLLLSLLLSAFGCSASNPPSGTYCCEKTGQYITFVDDEFACYSFLITGEFGFYTEGPFYMSGNNVRLTYSDGSQNSSGDLVYDELNDTLLEYGKNSYYKAP